MSETFPAAAKQTQTELVAGAIGKYECRYEVTWKRKFKFPWREADSPNYLDDKVDSDQ